MSSLERQLFGKPLPGTPRSAPVVGPKSRAVNSRDYSPLSWNAYFDSSLDLPINGDSFRVYTSGFDELSSDTSAVTPVLVLLHGGGYSSLTWALFAKCIRQLCDCRLMAIDMRGHGNTFTSNDNDLSASTLVNDINNIVNHLFSDANIPPLVMIGHSMGGAIAVRLTATLHELIPRIIGLVVIDVVEGTAMDALHSMQSFLRGRPSKFVSLENAIEWCVRSGQTRNTEAARISMPGQLKNITTNMTATHELQSIDGNGSQALNYNDSSQSVAKRKIDGKYSAFEEISELDEELASDPSPNNASTFKAPPTKLESGYTWRIDLSLSEPYWEGWFSDLSSVFLSCEADAKLLLLAGIDRLDRTLTIGQMQGRFQMQVLPKCGHTVQEDAPHKVAEAIASFLIRNKFCQPLSDFEKPFPSC